MFQESTATLLAEIANLKTIIGRFSEFSKMPQPQLQEVNPNEIMQGVSRLFEANLRRSGNALPGIWNLMDRGRRTPADPDFLNRRFPNPCLHLMARWRNE